MNEALRRRNPRTRGACGGLYRIWSGNVIVLVRRKQLGAFERPHFCSHEALWSGPKARQKAVARLHVSKPIAAERLHMDEYILGPFAARQETKAPNAIEPLDDHNFEAANVGDLNMGARRTQLRGMNRFASFDRKDAKNLHTSVAARRLENYTRAFMNRLKPIPPQNRDVQQHIRLAAVGYDEAVTLGYVKPFDAPSKLYQRNALSAFRSA
jgi:hypothetical protein